MTRPSRCLALICVAFLGSVFTLGQSGPQSGTPTFGASEDHTIDSIDLATLTPSVRVPVLKKAGAIRFDYSLVLRSACGVSGTGGGTTLYCGPQFIGHPYSGSALLVETSNLIGMRLVYSNSQTAGLCTTYSGFALIDASGTAHHLSSAGDSWTLCNTTGSGGFTDTTIDNSGYVVTASGSAGTFTVWDASGNYSNPTTLANTAYTTSETDPFSNSISLSSISGGVYTDSLGVPALTSVSSPYVGWQWTDTNNHTQSFSEEPQSALNTNINLGCAANPNTVGSVSPYLYSYPDGTSITLGLEQGSGGTGTTTGRISSVTLRTGGQITYTYGALTCIGNAPNELVIPSSLTRTTLDGTTTYSWSGSASQATVTKLDPGKNKTLYSFVEINPCTTCWQYQTTLTEVQTYQNVGTVSSPSYQLLTTDVYCYNGNATSCSTTIPEYPITQKDTYHYIGTGSLQVSHTTTLYDTHGNVTSSSIYDYISGVTITTTTQYGSWNGSSCVGIANNINNKPCDIKKMDGAGHTLSETRNTYNTTNGGLTASSSWTGSLWLTTNYVVNPNGTIQSSTTPNGLVTSHLYNGAGGCNNLLVTSTTQTVASGDTLSSYQQWDCNGAVVVNTTDLNGAQTFSAYDPLFRISSFTDEVGAVTNTTYTSTTIESSESFNSGNSIDDTIKTLDGLGRTIRTQHKQGPSSANYDTVSTAYSWNGPNRQTSATTPCTQPLGNDCTSNYITSTFDPLGRGLLTTDAGGGTNTHTYLNNDSSVALGPAPTGENTKTVQTEVDGLARTKSVCSLEPSGGGSSCGQAMGNSGVLNTYTYTLATGSTTTSVARGSQTKTSVKDALGRMTSYTSPEASAAWTYIYDSTDSRCGSVWNSYGDLMETVDPNGNVLCYTYDKLHRVVNVNANGTTCRHFYYDNSSGYSGSIPSGVSTPTYSMGRVVEAATDACTSGTLITDEWFSYDKPGRMTDKWELTPHSGQYYHAVATFFENDKVNTLQLANPSLYTMTYALDGEGRWNTLTDTTTGQALVSGPASSMYNAASQPIEIDLTGPDKDLYTYDATGRMQTFTFEVGNPLKTLVGTLTWNANGTPNNLAIVDGFNSAGTQTCNFNSLLPGGMGYDDLGRLLGVDCGSGDWGQTFSYDSDDNLTKTQMSGRPGTTWNPGYSSTNNHCSICSYDANGNVKSDGNANYFWNEFSKLASAATSGTPTCGSSGQCLTYDAFGRIVEQSNGTAWTVRWITQLGETVYMNGATPAYAYWPAPGNGKVLVSQSSPYQNYLHSDWLGNARVVSDLGHTVVTDQAYTPYGEVYDIFDSNSAQHKVFAGLTGDFFPSTTTPLMWDTPNRELSMVSRWLSPDPAGASWNAYAYPINPNIATDPSGAMQEYHTDCCEGDGSFLSPDDLTDDSIITEAAEEGAGATNTASNDHMASTSAATDGGTLNGQSQADSAQNACQSGNCNVKVISDTGPTGTVNPLTGTVQRDVTYQAVDSSGKSVKGAEISLHETPLPGKEGGDAKNYSYASGKGTSNSEKGSEDYHRAGQFGDQMTTGGKGSAGFRQTYTVEGKPANIIWPQKAGDVVAPSQKVFDTPQKVVIIPEVSQ